MQKLAAGFLRQAWYFARLVVDVIVILPSMTRYSMTAETVFLVLSYPRHDGMARTINDFVNLGHFKGERRNMSARVSGGRLGYVTQSCSFFWLH